MSDAYTEDKLVEQSAIGLFAKLAGPRCLCWKISSAQLARYRARRRAM